MRGQEQGRSRGASRGSQMLILNCLSFGRVTTCPYPRGSGLCGELCCQPLGPVVWDTHCPPACAIPRSLGSSAWSHRNHTGMSLPSPGRLPAWDEFTQLRTSACHPARAPAALLSMQPSPAMAVNPRRQAQRAAPWSCADWVVGCTAGLVQRPCSQFPVPPPLPL